MGHWRRPKRLIVEGNRSRHDYGIWASRYQSRIVARTGKRGKMKRRRERGNEASLSTRVVASIKTGASIFSHLRNVCCFYYQWGNHESSSTWRPLVQGFPPAEYVLRAASLPSRRPGIRMAVSRGRRSETTFGQGERPRTVLDRPVCRKGVGMICAGGVGITSGLAP
jgi:hypothetical protein